MAKEAKKKATKKTPPKQTGAVTISARLDPLTRYGLELTARAQRRSLSDVVTWAIDQVASQTPIPGSSEGDIKQLAIQSWSPNELERIIQLGMWCPELLEFEESNIWRVIRETPELWHTPIKRDDVIKLGQFNWERLERQLAAVDAVVREKARQTPVTGLTYLQITTLGWDQSPYRDSSQDLPF